MKLPFVSRERFEDEVKRSEKLEAECERLRALLIPGLRESQPAPEKMKLDLNTDLSKIQPVPGKPTIANVTAQANQAALTRSKTPGSKPLSQEVIEIDMSHWRKASGD